jgi:amino acid transporter
MSRSARAAAYIAAGLAFASAATTAYWLFGGTTLLDTLGGSVERLARDRRSAALALAVAVAVVKSVAGLLALLLLSPARRRWRIIVGLDILAGCPVLWGAANLLVGAVVLSGAVDRSDIDRHALRWHVFLWDAWFLVSGLTLALAVAGAIRASHLDRTRPAPPL